MFQVLSISLAALGSLMFLRKNKPKTLIPIIYACAGIVATMPSITRCVTAVQDRVSYCSVKSILSCCAAFSELCFLVRFEWLVAVI